MSKKSEGNGNLYHDLRALWKQANPFESGRISDEKFQKFWKINKQNKTILSDKKTELKLKIAGRGKLIVTSLRKQLIAKGMGNDSPLAQDSQGPVGLSQHHLSPNHPPTTHPIEAEMRPEVVNLSSELDSREENDTLPQSHVREKPAQERSKQAIYELQEMISRMQDAKEIGILSDKQLAELNQMRKQLKEHKLKLKRLQTGQVASRKLRRKQRRALEKAKIKAPKELSDVIHDTVGRPRLERDQPDLLDTIIKITMEHCSADERRRSDNLKCMKTLDDLLMELQEMGHNISRNGLYVRLLPRRLDSAEGKRHTKTVPVKLIRPQNSLRKTHEDSHFAAATVRYIKDIAGTFGEKSVFVLSQDDKARVPLGLPAATKQGPILMRMEYRVQLPDHDWVVANRHKLIPSVYAALQITDGRVMYSGPTHIAIRSGKHDSSTASTHAQDLERLLKLNSFKKFCRSDDGEVKPIWIIMVDGGPDENPRFPKTLAFGAQHFKEHNLDALFIVAHAPHQSASNPVERRMAPLSRDLCGIILPYDTFGTHLDGNGRTLDTEMEVKNFGKAGEILAEIWSQRVIDGYEVDALYIQPKGNGTGSVSGTDSVSYLREGDPDWLDEAWKTKHVRQSQYLLQIMKCGNQTCCSNPRTNLRRFLGDRFLPSPVRFIKSANGLVPASVECTDGHFMDLSTRLCMEFCLPNLPFDHFCPSVTGKLIDQTCSSCGIGFPTKKAYLAHKRWHRVSNVTEEVEHEDEEADNSSRNDSTEVTNQLHQIRNLSTWLKSPFTEEDE